VLLFKKNKQKELNVIVAYEKELHDLFLMQQVYGTLFSLINKLQITGDKYLNTLTSRQFMTIVAILHLHGEEATMNNIARKLGTSRQNANRMISGLEKAGYVNIVPSTTDKRASNVSLTKKGEEVTINASTKAVEFMADIFKEFQTSELENLWSLLKKLYTFDGVQHDGFEEEGLSLSSNEQLEKDIIKLFVGKKKRK